MRGDSRHQKETADITRGQQTSKGDSRQTKRRRETNIKQKQKITDACKKGRRDSIKDNKETRRDKKRYK